MSTKGCPHPPVQFNSKSKRLCAHVLKEIRTKGNEGGKDTLNEWSKHGSRIGRILSAGMQFGPKPNCITASRRVKMQRAEILFTLHVVEVLHSSETTGSTDPFSIKRRSASTALFFMESLAERHLSIKIFANSPPKLKSN